ncbi:MAG: phage tail tape measure protein [Rhodocyclales bacterium]|nr:phage tail tape measure protein [Rhodocyclales bacterium]
MSDRLELKVVFAAVDNFLRPVKAITDGARAASKELNAAKDALKGLNAQQKLIDNYRSTNKALGINAQDLEKARAEVRRIAEAMASTAAPTAAMQRAFKAATEEARNLAGAETRLLEKKQRLRHELAAAGIDTKQLASQQRDLKGRIDAATTAVTKQSEALEAANKRMQRLHAARAQLDKTNALRSKMATTGAGITAGGAAVGLPVAKATKDFADFETAMLGVARQVDGARDENGKLTATYYEIGQAVKSMSERLPLSANEIARIVEGGARMGIQGKDNLLTYTELTAVMAAAFDLPVDKVGEDIGKISQLYKVPIKDIHQLGDTINWLDDNALSKGGEIIDVMKRIAGTADMVKMNFREAAALGSTFLSLGATPEIAASASNAMMRELSVATMQSKRFREGLGMLKMDAKAIQFGMSKDATGTILKVLDAIKALPEQQQLEAATRLFGKEFGDDAAKLASNLDEYRRQLKLVNDEKARGSMGRENSARNDTINARMTMAKNALINLSSDLGEHMKPALVATMEKTLGIVKAMRAWAAENPQLASGIITVVKWLAVGLTVIGGLTLAAAAVLGPLAMIKFALTTLGISGGLAGGALALLKGALFGPIKMLLWLGSLAMAHPIIALIAALAAGALYVWSNWDTIGPKFKALLDGIGNWFGGLKDRAIETGSQMIDGMIAGINARWEALKAAVTGIGDASVGWLKEKLGIHSPSRVFAELGSFTMQGFEQGLAGGEDGPLKAVGDMARKLAGIGAGVLIGGAAAAGDLPLDTRPPIGAAAGTSGGSVTYQIIINAAPGTDNQNLAALVAREIERIEAKRAAQHRSRLRDSE